MLDSKSSGQGLTLGCGRVRDFFSFSKSVLTELSVPVLHLCVYHAPVFFFALSRLPAHLSLREGLKAPGMVWWLFSWCFEPGQP